MAIKQTISKGYQGLFLVVGTSRFFLLADFLFVYDLVIEPFFHKRNKIKRPPLALWFVVVPLAMSLIWSLNPNDGVQTVIRIVVLSLVIPTYKFRGEYNRIVFVSLVMLFGLVFFQSLETARPNGIHMNASSLGQSGFAFMSSKFWPVALAGGMILSFSIARAPLLVFFVFAIFSRNRLIRSTAIITTIIFFSMAFLQTPERVIISGISDGIERRIETLKPSKAVNNECGLERALEYKLLGYGFQSFCMSTGNVRPHNIYILSVYELGVLAIPFWFGIFLLARKFPIKVVAPLFILGLLTEELFGRPEGVYLIAIWLLYTWHGEDK